MSVVELNKTLAADTSRRCAPVAFDSYLLVEDIPGEAIRE